MIRGSQMQTFKEMNIIGIFITLFLSFVGSIVNFLRRDFKNKSVSYKIIIFIVDAISSMSIGIMTFMIAQGYGLNELLSCGLASFFGHQGTRAVYLMEIIIAEKLGSKKALEKIEKDNVK